MRFLSLIKVQESAMQRGPSDELMAEMGKLLDEMTKAGVMLETAGLRPTAEGTRLHLSRGKMSTTDGPFAEAKEIIGGYAILKVKSKEEAIAWTQRFLQIHGDVWELTCELRQIEDPPEA